MAQPQGVLDRPLPLQLRKKGHCCQLFSSTAPAVFVTSCRATSCTRHRHFDSIVNMSRAQGISIAVKSISALSNSSSYTKETADSVPFDPAVPVDDLTISTFCRFGGRRSMKSCKLLSSTNFLICRTSRSPYSFTLLSPSDPSADSSSMEVGTSEARFLMTSVERMCQSSWQQRWVQR